MGTRSWVLRAQKLRSHCWEPGAVKGSLVQAWSRSEYRLACLACCREIYLTNIYIPSSFSLTFFFPFFFFLSLSLYFSVTLSVTNAVFCAGPRGEKNRPHFSSFDRKITKNCLKECRMIRSRTCSSDSLSRIDVFSFCLSSFFSPDHYRSPSLVPENGLASRGLRPTVGSAR